MKKRLEKLNKETQKNRLEAFHLFEEATRLQINSRNTFVYSLEERVEMTKGFIEKQREAISKLIEANAFERESISIQRQLLKLACENFPAANG